MSELVHCLDAVLKLLWLGIDEMHRAAQARPLDPSQNTQSQHLNAAAISRIDARTMKARRRPCVPAPRIETAALRVAGAFTDSIVSGAVGAFITGGTDDRRRSRGIGMQIQLEMNKRRRLLFELQMKEFLRQIVPHDHRIRRPTWPGWGFFTSTFCGADLGSEAISGHLPSTPPQSPRTKTLAAWRSLAPNLVCAPPFRQFVGISWMDNAWPATRTWFHVT